MHIKFHNASCGFLFKEFYIFKYTNIKLGYKYTYDYMLTY